MEKQKHLAIVAGEASGDTLGAALMEALRAYTPQMDMRFSGVGGEKMQAAGLRSLAEMQRLSVMGIFEILQHVPDLLRLKAELLRAWRDDPPDVFIGIDAPDFNLRLASVMHQRRIPTVHYVSPSVWAWRQGRVRGIRSSVDLMLCLFDFEPDFYQKHQVHALCVGHPLRDQLDEIPSRSASLAALNLDSAARYVALMPGSRRSEIQHLLPLFWQASQALMKQDRQVQVLIPAPQASLRHIIEATLPADEARLHILPQSAVQVMPAAHFALAASGTVSLEAMLLNVPHIVAYRVHPLTAQLLRSLLKIQYVSLPNLLSGQAIVPEYLQEACTLESLTAGLSELNTQPERRTAQQRAFADLKERMPRHGSQRAAAAIVQHCGWNDECRD